MSAPTDRAGVVRVMAEASWHWRGGNQGEHILAALEAAGLRVVPVEATEEMLREGTRRMSYFAPTKGVYPRARTCWPAMLAASPFAPLKETQE